MSAKKQRLDMLVVEQGLADSREKAQRLIRAGQVRMGGHPVTKPGHAVAQDQILELLEPEPFVSRGGGKLEAAFKAFPLSVEGLVCADIGASTGGFTDCLLQHGALQVFAVDVGKGQLHWDLRNDERVVVMEGVNARHLEPDALKPPPAFAVVDVSFISLTKILPAVTACMASPGQLVTLIKPQFEAGREQVGRGGVVRDEAVREEVIEKIRKFGTEELGLEWLGLEQSPLKGPAGNIEFLSWWRRT